MGAGMRAPAEPGMMLAEIDTPALIIDLEALERNIATMRERVAGRPIALRPHSKTHKSTDIAGMQVAAGAIGVCCQKVSEAEIMVGGGIRDVFVSNEVVGARKLARLAALARHATVSVCVDDAGNVDALAAAAQRFGATLNVLVELDVGAGRCGVETPAQVLALAQQIDAQRSLRFAGIQAYQGSAQHMREHDERGAAIARAVARVQATTALLVQHGLRCDTVAGAGTGTFEFELESGVYTELQVGSYVFMDADYARNRGRPGSNATPFVHALFLLTTVMSAPTPDRCICDAGLKALSVDSGMPDVAGFPGLTYAGASDEHGKLVVSGDAPALGDKIRLIPGHCDPTVNLHDWYVGVRAGRVECLWPVSARGAVF